LLGYTENEIEMIANIARYHRKSPPKRKHEGYARLDKSGRITVERLSAFLRIAVALDRRQIGAIEHLECRVESPNLHLYLYPQKPEDDCALELWNLGYKKSWFESLFNLKIQPHLSMSKVAQKKKVSKHS
jgi:exopolyphosphatase/guanosine-5'-triphosphate,3'-diphosphate pyrophosphatase